MPWGELLVRAIAGGAIVSVFAFIGDVVKPKSFAGLFGGAPSVALASLALTFHSHTPAYVSVEATSMIAGAIAFVVYAGTVCRLLRGGRNSVRIAASAALALWFVVAFAVWRGSLHAYRF